MFVCVANLASCSPSREAAAAAAASWLIGEEPDEEVGLIVAAAAASGGERTTARRETGERKGNKQTREGRSELLERLSARTGMKLRKRGEADAPQREEDDEDEEAAFSALKPQMRRRRRRQTSWCGADVILTLFKRLCSRRRCSNRTI